MPPNRIENFIETFLFALGYKVFLLGGYRRRGPIHIETRSFAKSLVAVYRERVLSDFRILLSEFRCPDGRAVGVDCTLMENQRHAADWPSEGVPQARWARTGLYSSSICPLFFLYSSSSLGCFD
jgi:hypothetical protein